MVHGAGAVPFVMTPVDSVLCPLCVATTLGCEATGAITGTIINTGFDAVGVACALRVLLKASAAPANVLAAAAVITGFCCANVVGFCGVDKLLMLRRVIAALATVCVVVVFGAVCGGTDFGGVCVRLNVHVEGFDVGVGAGFGGGVVDGRGFAGDTGLGGT